MNKAQTKLLQSLVGRYFWWEPARSPMEYPNRAIAQVMEMGTFPDIRALERAFGKPRLIAVLQAAEPGWFSPRSWGFWHYRLGLAKHDEVPPLPERVIQEEVNTLTVLAPGGVKVSFFGGLGWGRFGHPELTDDSVLMVASINDLMGTKLKALLQRVEAKDYHDIATMIRSGASLEKGLAIAEKMFAPAFAAAPALKALTYFEGGDLSALPNETKAILVKAVGQVSELPELAPLSARLDS